MVASGQNDAFDGNLETIGSIGFSLDTKQQNANSNKVRSLSL